MASLLDRLKQPQVYLPVIIILVSIVVGIVFYFLLGRWLDSVIIGLAVAIIGLLITSLRSFYVMDRDERFGRGTERVAPERDDQASLVSGLQRAIEDIRSSRLGANGIDRLPWLLVLGPPGDGKTAALRHSGLELPAEYASRVSGAPTEGCDWWLTNDAILLDLAGSVLDVEDDETNDDWRALLRALRKQRPACPINGLVFAISVDTLLTRAPSDLDDIAHAFRRRVNEAIDVLGVDIPIYLVVTKLDHIEGFADAVGASPTFRPLQAVGWTNDQRVIASPQDRVNEALASVVTRLESILPDLLQRAPDTARRRRIFAFPAEFEHLVQATAAFTTRAFAPTPYDTPPFLRGVYFTSALRSGTTVSPQLHRLGHDWARQTVDHSLEGGGWFLADLFREIIVGDRDIALPVDRFGRRTRLAMNAAAAFVVAMLALWWGVAFTTNFLGIRRLAQESKVVTSGVTSLAAVDALRGAIDEEGRDLTVLRRGGLAGPIETSLERAKESFVWGFGRAFEVPTKRRIGSVVKGFDAGAFEALVELATDVSFMSKRGATGVAPRLVGFAPIADNESDRAAFDRDYAAFLAWTPEGEIQARIDEERDVVAEAAARLLELRRLETWAETNRSYPPIRYEDDGLPPGSVQVSGAYSRRAWDELVVRLLEAIQATGTASNKARTFRETYVDRFDEQWRAFLMGTPMPAASRPAVQSSPYLKLFEQIYGNTSAALPRGGPPPPWILAVREAHRETPSAAPPPVDGEPAEKPPPPPWTTYQAALVPIAADVAGAIADPESAIALATKMAQRQGTNFEKALKLVAVMVPSEGDPAAAKRIEEILSMPILDGGSAVIDSAFGALDRTWQAEVVEPSAGRLSSSKMQQLYGEGGAVQSLRDGPLRPFYRSGSPIPVIGDRTMPFGPQFLRWMRASERLQQVFAGGGMAGGSVSVRLQGVPAKPVRSRLGQLIRVDKQTIRMRCDAGIQDFTYRQGSTSGTLRWSPDCDEVSLRITVLEEGRPRDLLPKEWHGPMALPQFLQSAQRSGRELVWSLPFEDAGVTIEISYRMRQGDELMSMRHVDPPRSMRD